VPLLPPSKVLSSEAGRNCEPKDRDFPSNCGCWNLWCTALLLESLRACVCEIARCGWEEGER